MKAFAKRLTVTMMVAGIVGGVSAQTKWTVAKRYGEADSIYLSTVQKVGNWYFGFGKKGYGGNAASFTSVDGINWTIRTNDSIAFLPVAYTGSRYVAFSRSCIKTSTNGINWSVKTFGSSAIEFSSVTWSGSQLVVVGTIIKNTGSLDNRGSIGVILSSTDGTSWTQRYEDALSGTGLNSVIWTGSKFIAVGACGRCVSSTNGTSWTPVFIPLLQNLSGVVWTGAFIVATGEKGGSFVSTDGINWTIAATTSGLYNSYQNNPLWSGKSLVQRDNIYGWDTISHNSGNISAVNISLDGINWTTTPISLTGYNNNQLYLYSLIFTGTQFFAYGIGQSTINDSVYALILTAPLDTTLGTSPLAKRQYDSFSIFSNNSGPSKVFTYTLAETAPVTLRFFDLRGREVYSGINTVQGPGNYLFRVPTAGIAHGRYVQVFDAGNFHKREMVRLGN